jgi:hypothetical protein
MGFGFGLSIVKRLYDQQDWQLPLASGSSTIVFVLSR